MEKWSGKIAIVTGASAGIGDAIVRDLVKYGIDVIALARRLGRLEKLREDLKDSKGRVIPMKCDISDKDSVDATFDQIEKDFKVIHILVNNAGVAQFSGIFGESDSVENDIMCTINTNLFGLVRASRRAYKLMKNSDDHGIIINIGSVAGHYVPNIGGFVSNVYAGTKHAVRAITESMRQELVKMNDLKVRVCEISPGAVDTEIGSEVRNDPKYEAAVGDLKIAMLKSSDVSQTVLFMLMAPYEVNITELVIRPVGENF